MEERLSVKQWDEADRPREKLMAHGAETLTDAELLAILIGSGSAKESAVELMRRLMSDCRGSLRRLGRMSVGDLCSYTGIGEAKAVSILAACELGRRRAQELPEERLRLDTPQTLYKYYRRLEDNDREEFHVLLLNQHLHALRSVCVSRGGLTATSADIRLILHEALIAKAPCMAVCHNHPSGNPQPSKVDDQLTSRLLQAAQLMDIRLIDHIIIGNACYYSYQEQNRL